MTEQTIQSAIRHMNETIEQRRKDFTRSAVIGCVASTAMECLRQDSTIGSILTNAGIGALYVTGTDNNINLQCNCESDLTNNIVVGAVGFGMSTLGGRLVAGLSNNHSEE